MKIPLKKAYNWISNIGLENEHDFYFRTKSRVLNQTTAAIVFITLLMILEDIFYPNPTLIASILAFLLSVLLFLLRYYNRRFLADLTFTTLFPLLFFFISIFFGSELNLSYVYFTFIIVVLLAFEKLWLKILISSFIFILQVVEIYHNRLFGPIIEHNIPFVLDGIIILIISTASILILVLKQVGIIKNLYDEQKEINEALKIKNKELTKLINQNESKNHLLAIIAHDLKGPAASFNDLTKNIAFLIKKERPEQIKKMAYDFEVAGGKLFYTITNLLNWVTSQRREIIYTKSKFDLTLLIKEVIDSVSFQSHYKKINIKYEFGDFPKLATDRGMLKIILFNILNNAIKFSKPNNEVVIKYSENSKFNIIEVIDFGDGIEEGMIARIRSEEIITTQGTLHEKGYGIGLKICFVLIKYLGGEITIKSKVGKGTTFGIWISR